MVQVVLWYSHVLILFVVLFLRPQLIKSPPVVGVSDEDLEAQLRRLQAENQAEEERREKRRRLVLELQKEKEKAAKLRAGQ